MCNSDGSKSFGRGVLVLQSDIDLTLLQTFAGSENFFAGDICVWYGMVWYGTLLWSSISLRLQITIL